MSTELSPSQCDMWPLNLILFNLSQSVRGNFASGLQHFKTFKNFKLSGPVSITPKKTSLHDFKKLLAQQSPGPNPHRPSARELLERSASASAKPGASEPVYGASPGKPAGSLRKRTSPWVDKRFSVIQEEVEGSRENIVE